MPIKKKSDWNDEVAPRHLMYRQGALSRIVVSAHGWWLQFFILGVQGGFLSCGGVRP